MIVKGFLETFRWLFMVYHQHISGRLCVFLRKKEMIIIATNNNNNKDSLGKNRIHLGQGVHLFAVYKKKVVQGYTTEDADIRQRHRNLEVEVVSQVSLRG